MASDKPNNLNLTFTQRVAPYGGLPSSDMWNDTFSELANDFATITSEWNSKLVPILDSLPYGIEDTSINATKNGLDGCNLWVDSNVSSTSLDQTYFDAGNNRPVTVKEAFTDVYEYVDSVVDQVREDVEGTSAGLTSAQEAAIGSHIFDPLTTSSSISLDGKSENNRLNITQLAKDLYGSSYYSLDNDGAANLVNSVRAMVGALLTLHNGTWDTDIVVDHSGIVVSVTQADINSSSPGDDTFAGVPADLEEDLDQLRTKIKDLKGTAGWTTALSALYAGGADSLEELLTTTAGTGAKSASNPWGYTYSDIPNLSTYLNAIKTFTGQSALGDTSTTYTYNNYVTDGDSLEDGISKLDQQLYGVTASGLLPTAQLAALETFTGQNNDTDSSPVYISHQAIQDGNSLETACGKLDAAIATLSGQAILADGTKTMAADLEVVPSGNGIVLRDANGVRWRVTVNTSGALVVASL